MSAIDNLRNAVEAVAAELDGGHRMVLADARGYWCACGSKWDRDDGCQRVSTVGHVLFLLETHGLFSEDGTYAMPDGTIYMRDPDVWNPLFSTLLD